MSLIAWYPLNKDTKDYSGNNYDLTNNGTTLDGNGKIGSCYSFNAAASNYMICDEVNFSNMQNEFTVTAWIKSTQDNNSNGTFLSLGESAITIDYDKNSNILRAFIYAKETNAPIVQGIEIEKDKWLHVAYKFEKGCLYLYVNGELKTSFDTDNTVKIKDTDKLYIGSRDYGTPNYCNGFVNDVRIYNEALSAKTIREIAQAKMVHCKMNHEFLEPAINFYKDKTQIVHQKVEPKWLSNHEVIFKTTGGNNGFFK